MAINDPNYRYAIQTFETDGVETDYEINFDGGYIRQSDVVAYSLGLIEFEGFDEDGNPATIITVDPDDRIVHALTFVSEAGTTATVRITPAVADNRRLYIYRSTEKSEPMVDYSDGSVLTSANLDLANKQAIFGIAEIMDGLNAAQINIDQQVQEIVDIRSLVTLLYQQVLVLLAAGGIVSVAPHKYAFIGNGEDTDFPMVGADVFNASFYDTAVAGLQQEPDVDFTIVAGATIADTLMRFAVPLPDGVEAFAVMRGFARPYTGPAPITAQDLRMPIIVNADEVYFIDKASEFALVDCTDADGCLVTINAIPGVGDPEDLLGDGSYTSVCQSGLEPVVIEADVGVTMIVPGGCLPQTRALGSTVTMTCKNADTNTWQLSGDLAKE